MQSCDVNVGLAPTIVWKKNCSSQSITQRNTTQDTLRTSGIVHCQLQSSIICMVAWVTRANKDTNVQNVSKRQQLVGNLTARSVATDLFQLDEKNFIGGRLLLTVSRNYTTTSTIIIQALKVLFVSHGIPEEFISDNGPFLRNSLIFQRNMHKTSSPHYPRGNDLAERTVCTMQQLLKKSKDHYLALLEYRKTPMSWCQMSPALLMGRQL